MASKGKDSAPGKDKRSPSPSKLHRPANSATSANSPNLRSSRPSTLDKSLSTKTAQSSEKKPVPNYLKPTISSSGEQPSSNQLAPKKPFLTRKSSFDKPPPSSQVRKPLPSLSKSFRERKPTSSFSPVSKKTSTLKKPTSSTTSSIKSEDHDHDDLKVIHEAMNSDKLSEREDEESLMGDVEEELVKVESGLELFPHDISIPVEIMENVETNTNDGDLKIVQDDERLKPYDIPTISEEEKNEEITTKTHGEEIEDAVSRVDEEMMERKEKGESSNVQGEEESSIDQQTKSEEKEEERGEEGKLEREEKEREEKEREEKEREEKEREKEREDTKGKKAVEERNAEAKNIQVVKRQATNKKETAPAYNDVIEETKSKLMEKRKSKVGALVGAFETVISLEEPKG